MRSESRFVAVRAASSNVHNHAIVAATTIGAELSEPAMPATTPTPVRMPASPGGPNADGGQQAGDAVAVVERLAGEHTRVDRLRDAGDDAEAQRHHEHDPAEDHDEVGRVGARAADHQRGHAEQHAGDRGADEGCDRADLLGAAVPERTAQQPPAQAYVDGDDGDARRSGSSVPTHPGPIHPSQASASGSDSEAPTTSMNASSRRRPARSASIGPRATTRP